MDKRVTIKDIAEEAGVSISSVHQALHGKSGVSEATRNKIMQLAEEMNYRPNVLASSLKSEPRSVAVILPAADIGSRYYFQKMWEAVDDYEATAADYNITLVRFTCDSKDGAMKYFDPEDYSGVVSVGLREYFQESDFERVSNPGIPVVLVDNDSLGFERLCCVQADAHVVGRVTAELLLDMVHRLDGKIIVSGVGPSYENRRLTEGAVSEYFEEEGLADKLLFLNFDHDDEECQQEVEKAIRDNRIAGACAVNSRSTAVLGKAIRNTGRAGAFPFIGSGLFEESRKFLHDNVITALVDKKPYDQCRTALKTMTDYLVKNEQPAQHTKATRLDVIFRSTVDQY